MTYVVAAYHFTPLRILVVPICVPKEPPYLASEIRSSTECGQLSKNFEFGANIDVLSHEMAPPGYMVTLSIKITVPSLTLPGGRSYQCT
jgi:hypothetical protein